MKVTAPSLDEEVVGHPSVFEIMDSGGNDGSECLDVVEAEMWSLFTLLHPSQRVVHTYNMTDSRQHVN